MPLDLLSQLAVSVLPVTFSDPQDIAKASFLVSGQFVHGSLPNEVNEGVGWHYDGHAVVLQITPKGELASRSRLRR